MKELHFSLIGQAPLSWSRHIQMPREIGETGDAYEQRTWRERLHTTEAGIVYIPPTAVKNCLADVARYLAESVPGKGKATYTKYFEAGVLVTEPLIIMDPTTGRPIHKDDVEHEAVFVPSDGKRGGGTRVWKLFPYIPRWRADGALIIFDQLLCDHVDKVCEYLEHSGRVIGVGRFRPRRGGYYGRFTVENIRMSEVML